MSGGTTRRDAPSGTDADLTYEQARAALEDVVRRLEAGGVPLEESLALWEQGEHLARQCQQWLDGARARMQAVRDSTDSDSTDSDSPDSDSTGSDSTDLDAGGNEPEAG